MAKLCAFSAQPVIPDQRRSRADPESVEGRCAFRWIPGQARHDALSGLQPSAKRAFSAASTGAGTKGETSPPIAAIWRTSVAVM